MEPSKPKLTTRLKSRLNAKKLSSLLSRPKGWFEKRKQESKEPKKEKIKKEKIKEPASVRYFTFFLTLISMSLVLTFIPFFPQPLPILVAVLIAFLTLASPRVGLAIGGIPIALGLLFQLSKMDFIAGLGTTQVRVFAVALLLFFFVMLPIRFRRYEDAMAINIGIIAACLVFFAPTYFLAIPLLLTFAVFAKVTQAGLSVAYYALVAIPLQLEQYFQLVNTIPATEFWLDPISVPPLYVPLNGIISQIQDTMSRFRMFDVTQSLGSITGQLTSTPIATVHTVRSAIDQYIDSLPGIIMFVVIFGGTVAAIAFILPRLAKGAMSRTGRLSPILAAIGITSLFFLFASTLHQALAFSVSLDATTMVEGVLAAGLFALPLAMTNFSPKRRDAIEKKSAIVTAKSQELLSKQKSIEELMGKAKDTIPVNVRSPEGRSEVLANRLNEIVTRGSSKAYGLPELDRKIAELNGDLKLSVDSLALEFNEILSKYQLATNYKYSALTRNLHELGYEIKNPVALTYEKDQPAEQRIEAIKQVLDSGRATGVEIGQVSEGIYRALASLYDTSLPAENGTVTYVKQRLQQKAAPWIATDALIVSLNSWDRNYSPHITKSVEVLKKSVTYLENLKTQSKTLAIILGNNYRQVDEQLKKVDEIKAVTKQPATLLNVPIIENAFQTLFAVTRGILSGIYAEMKAKEESIENLQPILDYFWEKNIPLGEQMAVEIEIMSDPTKYTLNKAMESLPAAQSFIDRGITTVSLYNEKNELLLNYPLAKTVIEDLIRQKKRVSIDDLPFEPKDAEKYLRLFQNQRYREFTFDEADLQLMKKV